MEHYEKKISFLGENIQTIRKHRGMKQQELADKIGINMQSLSKIERGVGWRTLWLDYGEEYSFAGAKRGRTSKM